MKKPKLQIEKKAKSKTKPTHPGPLVTRDSVLPHRIPGGKLAGVELNLVWYGLNLIYDVSTDPVFKNRPKSLKKLGRQLMSLVPEGYEGSIHPPLSAKQLKRIIDDSDAVAYVRSCSNVPIGPKTLQTLALIAEVLIAEQPSS